MPLLSLHFLRHLSNSGPEATAWPYGRGRGRVRFRVRLRVRLS